ncbi:hypothetical protein [Oceanihabitans sediminis]|uniref:hypothetical protein n=1 Tax=Oceanihabitans sediminis TaxID=1812012 RepID=UPI00299F1419|nr:hypothetical protein [Oceanihabitans sediminis]MDX1279362.1 hypothetical protein [Oceanihabitans sediminis]
MNILVKGTLVMFVCIFIMQFGVEMHEETHVQIYKMFGYENATATVNLLSGYTESGLPKARLTPDEMIAMKSLQSWVEIIGYNLFVVYLFVSLIVTLWFFNSETEKEYRKLLKYLKRCDQWKKKKSEK